MKCSVTYIEELRDNTFALSFNSSVLSQAVPGSFVHILCGAENARVLRRPISVADYFLNETTGESETTIIFEVRGEGTRWLSERCEGDIIDVLGALGHGYPLSEEIIPAGGRILLVGGGLGAAPLLFAASHLGAVYPQCCDAALGFKSKEHIILSGDFGRLCGKALIATDDGSYGTHGTAVDIARELLPCGGYESVYACGPKPMLRAVSLLAEEANTPCYVSLEEHMACGIGACLGCAVRTVQDGVERSSRVCADGPVFLSSEIIW